jgi:hypothetical protein
VCACAGVVGPANKSDARQEALDKKERELIEAMATIRTLRADQAMPCHAMPCHAMPCHATIAVKPQRAAHGATEH